MAINKQVMALAVLQLPFICECLLCPELVILYLPAFWLNVMEYKTAVHHTWLLLSVSQPDCSSNYSCHADC